MLANTRSIRNNTALAQYGITPSGYQDIMDHLENTICSENSGTLSPEELEELQPYIAFARRTLKVTVPSSSIEEKQQGGVPPYEFNNENNNDVFNQINELSNIEAHKKLAKVKRERNRETHRLELDRDRKEWDNSITRRTVYGVLMMAQLLNDVFGVKHKIDAAMSELYEEANNCSETHSGEQLAIASPEFNESIVGWPSITWPSIMFPSRAASKETPAPTLKSVERMPVNVISNPIKPFKIGSIADANKLENGIHEIIDIYKTVEGAFGWKKGIRSKNEDQSPFWCGRLTEEGIRVSGGAASPFICLVGDWHAKIQKDQKCKTPCTKNSGCLNIGATEYQTDPTTGNKFPVRTGLLSFAQQIVDALGIPVIMNLESFIPLGSNINTNYTHVGEDSALKHTTAVSINCIAKPSFEEAIQKDRHTNTTTCYNSNIHFHLQDQRYNHTNIDSIYANFRDMILELQRGYRASAKQTAMSFLDNYNKSGMESGELFSYLRFLFDNTKKIRDLFVHPIFKKYSKTYLEFSTLPEEIKEASFRMMGNNPISFKDNIDTDSGKLHQTLLKIVDHLDRQEYDDLYAICTSGSKHLTTVKGVNVVNFQQFMPDLESIRLIMTSGFALPISQFGSQHTSHIKDILVKSGWFEESIAFMPTDRIKCAERVLSKRVVPPSSSSSYPRVPTISGIDPTQFPEKYKTSPRLGYGEKMVSRLANFAFGPSLPGPSYPQLENGWFNRLRAKQFENLTKKEKKYVASLSWKKMGDLTAEDKEYLRYIGRLYNRSKKNLPNQFYRKQHQRGVELRTNQTRRREKAQQQESLGVFERAKSFFTGTHVKKGISHTLRPSNRQRQQNEAKNGGTRRKQKRSNPTRRIKRQSKPVHPSFK
jgi:hypothetical protein